MAKIRKVVDELNQVLEEELGLYIPGDLENPDIPEDDLAAGLAMASRTDQPIESGGRYFLSLPLLADRPTALFVAANGPASRDLLMLSARILQGARQLKSNSSRQKAFLKNIILGNELPSDIPLKARDYEVNYSLSRQLLLLDFIEATDQTCLSIIEDCLDQPNDMFLRMDEKQIVLLLSLENRDQADVDRLAQDLLDRFRRNGRLLKIGIGLPAEHLKDISNSYRQATLSLTIGAIFKQNKEIIRYNQLGLGRLIYQLPPTLCRIFLNEVFAPDTYEALDPETLLTIDKFFENNLNGSETSRQLFVHRNTLVYRLDKVQKITGLDLRTFDDAVLFKIASMVRQYLEAIDQQGEEEKLAQQG